MKNLIVCLLMAVTFLQCTTEQEMENQSTDQNLLYEQGLDLSTQLPKAALDRTNEGLYVGTVATTDLTFHERIFINVNNDGQINAQVTANNGLTKHLLKGQRVSKSSHQYYFTGNIGHFNLTIENNEAVITSAIFQDKVAEVNTAKSTSGSRMVFSLGTYTSNDGTHTGTWDIGFNTDDPFNYGVEMIFIMNAGGTTATVDSTDGAYFRLCFEDPNTGFTDIHYLLVMEGTYDLLNLPLSISLDGTAYFLDASGCNEPYPNTGVSYLVNSWSWNGLSGTITSDFTEFLPL